MFGPFQRAKWVKLSAFFGHNIARGSGGDDGMNPKPNKKNVLRTRILRNYCLQGLFHTVPSSFVLHCSIKNLNSSVIHIALMSCHSDL